MKSKTDMQKGRKSPVSVPAMYLLPLELNHLADSGIASIFLPVSRRHYSPVRSTHTLPLYFVRYRRAASINIVADMANSERASWHRPTSRLVKQKSRFALKLTDTGFYSENLLSPVSSYIVLDPSL